MPVWKAALLGVIQGVTCVLPVSSSGHIALFGRLLGESTASSLSFMVYLHIGTLVAVVWTFAGDLRKLLRACLLILRDLARNLVTFNRITFMRKKGTYRALLHGNYRRLAALLVTAAAVEAVVSLFMRNFSFLGASNLLITAMGFFVTALLLFISSFTPEVKRNPLRCGFRDALLAGALQGAASLPGISRLGMAMSASCLSGLERPFMVRFSFLLAIPAILGGMIGILPSVQAQAEIPPQIGACIIGIVVSAFVSTAMLQLVKRILSRKASRLFSVYTAVIGILCIVLYFR